MVKWSSGIGGVTSRILWHARLMTTIVTLTGYFKMVSLEDSKCLCLCGSVLKE